MAKETITATLKNIRFQNDSGFIIGMAVTAGDTLGFKGDFGILGNMLNPQESMTYQLTGEWSIHPDFGKQFKFQQYTPVKPKDTSGIYKYLVRTAKWIGPSIAQQLVEIYGDETLEVLRNDPEIVAAEIRGITETKAKEIQQILIDHEELESILVDLMKVLDIPGLRKSLPYELIEKFGSNAAEILKKNPYVITQFHGSGFLIADRLGMQRLDIPPDSMFRIKAAIEYAILQDLHSNGNTWISRKSLTNEVKDLTSIEDIKRIELGIDELLALEAIVDASGGEWLALWDVDQNETYVADKIKEMIKEDYGQSN